jgi:hypothetical protein
MWLSLGEYMVFGIDPMVFSWLMVFVHGIPLSHMVLVYMVFVERMDLESLDHLYIG